jgi:simple sugar transport system permease protein
VAASFAGGAAWGFLPGWLKARRGTHEVITTIMLNFIAVALTGYLVTYVTSVRETIHTPEIGAGARLARLDEFFPAFHGSPVNLALPLSLLAAWAAHFVLFRTRPGYEIRAVGHSPAAAEYAGIPVGRRLVHTMALSGGLAGLVGTNYVLGYKYYFQAGFTGGVGFMGIAVALLGRNHPVGIVLAAFLFGLLSHGGLVINRLVPKELVDILQAVVILTVVSSTVVVRALLARAQKKALAS